MEARETYVERFDEISSFILRLIEKVYDEEIELALEVRRVIWRLKKSVPDEMFVTGLLGYIKYSSDHKIDEEVVLRTLLIDISEYDINRDKAWFLAKTASYAAYLNVHEDISDEN